MRTRGWRRIGTAIVRWPGPVLAVACAVALVGLLALPGYKTSYDTRPYMPASAPANVGYAAAERHFSRARLEPELLMIETDHDMRNPADMLILDRVAKAIFHVPGIAQVQTITRPLGTPLVHSSLAFQISAQSASQHRKPDVPTRSRERHAEAGRRADEDDQHFEAAVRPAAGARCHHARARPKAFTTRSPPSMTCATRSRISTTSSGRFAVISTGKSIATTFRSALRSGPSSTRSTASTSSAHSSKTSRRLWTNSMRCSRNWWR